MRRAVASSALQRQLRFPSAQWLSTASIHTKRPEDVACPMAPARSVHHELGVWTGGVHHGRRLLDFVAL